MFLVETVDEVLFISFNCIIKKCFPTSRRIVIFGAGVRGIIFGYLLEQNGYSDFLYADNDEAKWGRELNGHRIIGGDKVLKGKDLVIVSIEYAEEIAKPLRKEGFIEEEDLVILHSGIQESFEKEFYDKRETNTLIFGDAGITSAVLSEERKVSLQSELRELLGDNTRYLGLSAVGMNQIYELLRMQKEYVSKSAKRVILFVRFEMLTKHEQFLPRVQHGSLMQKIYEGLGIKDDEFEDFVQISFVREKNYVVEKKYSPVRTDESAKKTAFEFMHCNLLFKLDECSEQYLTLERIFRYCNVKDMECIFVVMPINYDEVYSAFPEEGCLPLNNLDKLKNMSESYGVRFLDYSRLLSSDEFVICAAIDEGIRENGRRKLVEEIKKYI